MSLALAIRTKPTKRQSSMLDDCLAAQHFSVDIVIYGALASQMVTVAWLVFASNYQYILDTASQASSSNIQAQVSRDLSNYLSIDLFC
jgi:hypothetical protein